MAQAYGELQRKVGVLEERLAQATVTAAAGEAVKKRLQDVEIEFKQEREKHFEAQRQVAVLEEKLKNAELAAREAQGEAQGARDRLREVELKDVANASNTRLVAPPSALLLHLLSACLPLPPYLLFLLHASFSDRVSRSTPPSHASMIA